ncbi:MAG: hypothetical protein AVDCRST_MAG30-3735, partial [uncultured Solirubrobacteraceae bacterium]
GDPRVGDDGPRPLALHDLPARPLLGRDRRRVPRRGARLDRHRAPPQRAVGARAGRHEHRHGAPGDPRRGHRHGHRVLHRAPARERQPGL